MNSAIRVASGEIVVLIQDDCICEPGLVAGAYRGARVRWTSGPLGPRISTPRVSPHCSHQHSYGNVDNTISFDSQWKCQAFRIWLSAQIAPCGDHCCRRIPFRCQSYLRHAEAEHAYRLQQAGARFRRYAPTAVAYRLYDQTPDAMVSDARELSAFEVSFARSQPAYRAMSSIAK